MATDFAGVRRRLGGNGDFDPLAQTDPGTVPDSPAPINATNPESPVRMPDTGSTQPPSTQPTTQPEPGGYPGSPAYANGGTTPITFPSGQSYGGSSTTPPPQGKLTAPTDGNWQQWFANLEKGQPSSYDAIRQWAPQLANAGVGISTNLEGDPSKIILPNGHYVSIVDANGKWRWVDQGTAADNAAKQASGASGGSAADLASLGVKSSQPEPPDPFTTQLQGKLSELIGNNGRFDDGTEALNLENTRQAADRARKSEYSGALSELASRGLLPESTPGGQGGLALDALGRIEANDIAPNFANATRDWQINEANNASNRLTGALQTGVNEQGTLGQIAVQVLAQNNQFNEFLADFGLRRDQALYDIQSGQAQSLLMAFQQWLQGTSISSNGAIK